LKDYEKKYLVFQNDLIKTGNLDALIVFTPGNYISKENVLNLIIKGDISLLSKKSNDSIAFNTYNKALIIATQLNDTILIVESLKKILKPLYKNRKSKKLFSKYLANYKTYLYDDNEKTLYNYYYYMNLASILRKDKIKDLNFNLHKAKNLRNFYLKAKYHQMIGLQYQYFKNELDSALIHYNKAKFFIDKKPYTFFKNELFGLNINTAIVHQLKKEYKLAEYYLLEANKVNIPSYRYLERVKLNNLLAENYSQLNDYFEAYRYLQYSKKYTDSLQEYNKAIAFSDIETKYQTEKKEKENLQLKQDNYEIEAKNIKNRNFLIGSILIIILGGTIAILTIKNSGRKRILAQQKEELEKQKNLTLLKEQELTTINAMVDGQEKERKRIAEDLHDNLGSVLATLKLHFENLKINRERKKINQEELFDKTESLIDEAYLKVRSIAHAKNAGVIAKQGLLLAIQMMAEKISSADKIKIDVIDFGLDKRLENNIEMTVFRIIQELITNIIKHANAKNATINISLYDKNLNIIIEDDGIGFEIKKVNLKDGMGISSIKTRVEHLKGTFEVDSSLGNGSSIIIDIPMN
jgi:signal transduction histidine kinase